MLAAQRSSAVTTPLQIESSQIGRKSRPLLARRQALIDVWRIVPAPGYCVSWSRVYTYQIELRFSCVRWYTSVCTRGRCSSVGFCIEKIMTQWNYYVVYQSAWKLISKPKTLRLSTDTNNIDSLSTLSINLRSDSAFEVVSHGASQQVDIETWSCSCFFAVSMRLPCRHKFAVCTIGLSERKIPVESVHNQWHTLKAIRF